MKAKILALLREREDYVSGQELCQRFGVSRTAVWKAMGQLKKEGYQIEAVQNRGYRLASNRQVYGRHELESRMDTAWAGKPVCFYEELASTNLQAKLDAENGAREGTLIVADMQTAGRGRRGRSWSSPPGTNVYFTLILKPDFRVELASMVTLVMGLAVAEGIRETCGLEARIKWPNDIVVNGKKVCGILAEMSTERDFIHYVVMGVGINVARQDFPPEIAQTASCLEQECGRAVSRAEIMVNVMRAFEKYYGIFCRDGSLAGLLERYNGMLAGKEGEVRVLDPKGRIPGHFQGHQPCGRAAGGAGGRHGGACVRRRGVRAGDLRVCVKRGKDCHARGFEKDCCAHGPGPDCGRAPGLGSLSTGCGEGTERGRSGGGDRWRVGIWCCAQPMPMSRNIISMSSLAGFRNPFRRSCASCACCSPRR